MLNLLIVEDKTPVTGRFKQLPGLKQSADDRITKVAKSVSGDALFRLMELGKFPFESSRDSNSSRSQKSGISTRTILLGRGDALPFLIGFILSPLYSPLDKPSVYIGFHQSSRECRNDHDLHGSDL